MKRPVAIQLSSSQQAAEEGSIRRPAALLRVATRSRALHSERAHSKPVCYYKERPDGRVSKQERQGVDDWTSVAANRPFETGAARPPQGEGVGSIGRVRVARKLIWSVVSPMQAAHHNHGE
jgi:hypothetical protein